MRIYAFAWLLVVGLLLPATASAAGFSAKLSAETHTPKANAHWHYKITVLDAKKQPMKASVTMQIVDPFGGVHPVEYSYSNKNVVNHKFTGTFRDWVTWPRESSGIRLTFRAMIKTSVGKTTLTYWVKTKL